MTAYYNEFDPGAAEWLRELIKAGLITDGEVDERSILDVRADELVGFIQCHFFAGIGGWSYALRLAGWPDDKPVWTGSPPCQPFSVAGQDKGRDDERHLSPHFIDLVRSARPPVLFGEQVASAAVFGKVAGKAKRGDASPPEWAWLDDLSDRLEAAHYAVGASDIPAAGVGAPHIRQRTFFGAYNLRSAAGGLGDSVGAGLEGHGGNGRDRNEPGRIGAQPHGPARATSAFDGLEHDPGNGRIERRAEPEGRGVVGGCGADRLALPNRRECDGLTEYGEHVTHGAQGGRFKRDSEPAGDREADRPNPLDGFWANADWLFCRDGKWRPVEPGSFPLAHGVPGRVGLLRGYGNAICPWAAKEFIQAFEGIAA